jgi:hypothetical protein
MDYLSQFTEILSFTILQQQKVHSAFPFDFDHIAIANYVKLQLHYTEPFAAYEMTIYTYTNCS